MKVFSISAQRKKCITRNYENIHRSFTISAKKVISIKNALLCFSLPEGFLLVCIMGHLNVDPKRRKGIIIIYFFSWKFNPEVLRQNKSLIFFG